MPGATGVSTATVHLQYVLWLKNDVMKQRASADSVECDQPRIALLSIHLGGHRLSYIDLFSSLCADAGLAPTLLRSWGAGAKHRGPLLVLMIEESFVSFAIVAIGRAVLGRSTTGLLFGGAGLVRRGGIKAAVKRSGLRLLKRLLQVTVLAITPFAVAPPLAALADEWIYDPQLWDVDRVEVMSSSLAEDVRTVAAGRSIVAALGRQGLEKGFDRFARLWRAHPELREHCLFLSAGAVEEGLEADASAFEAAGGYLVNRFVSDDELMSLYGVSTLVWALYAPVYDQSSGIMGRAMQLGRPSVVRRGSQIHDLALHLGVSVVAAPWDDDVGIAEAILRSLAAPPVSGPAIAGRLKAETLEVLQRHVLTAGGRAW